MQVIPAEQAHFGGLTWVRRLAPLAGQQHVLDVRLQQVQEGDALGAPTPDDDVTGVVRDAV